MDMVERVARALYAIRMELAEGANLPQYTWETERNPYREHCLREARAAIEAMRKPTDDMAQAGFAADAFRTQDIRLNVDFEPKAVWRAMIDAALTPEPQPQSPCP